MMAVGKQWDQIAEHVRRCREAVAGAAIASAEAAMPAVASRIEMTSFFIMSSTLLGSLSKGFSFWRQR